MCLYLTAELPSRLHHLEDIEKELRMIFPPSARGNTADTYRDFQATAIRNPFNAETAANPPQRLWENIERGLGFWRNTAYGNACAAQLLRRQGVAIQLRGKIVN